MKIDSVTAFLASHFDGATSKGNVVEIPPFRAPAIQPKPAPVKRIGLKANGLDTSWTRQRHEDATPEERYLKRESERIRHDLKLFYKEKK